MLRFIVYLNNLFQTRMGENFHVHTQAK